jgi:hypothetical protein
MATLELEKKARFVTDKNGKPVEVILSYSVYKRFLELETSMEIFKRKETQKSIKKAKEDINKRRFKTFDNADDAIKWLDK